MAPRHREGRGRHGGGARFARSFAAHAPHDPRRRAPADTSGSSSSVRAERLDEDSPVDARASLEDPRTSPGARTSPEDAWPAAARSERPRDRAPEPNPARLPEEVIASAGPEGSVLPRPVVHPRPGATAAQLRRFIKSRPYVPLHELRRRFGVNGNEDDVVSIDLPERRVWVGLPPDEGRMLAELVRQGEVGCELSIDPTSPVVVGVFPIRPVALGRAAHPAAAAD
jgi:hypothetical protein